MVLEGGRGEGGATTTTATRNNLALKLVVAGLQYFLKLKHTGIYERRNSKTIQAPSLPDPTPTRFRRGARVADSNQRRHSRLHAEPYTDNNCLSTSSVVVATFNDEWRIDVTCAIQGSVGHRDGSVI